MRGELAPDQASSTVVGADESFQLLAGAGGTYGPSAEAEGGGIGRIDGMVVLSVSESLACRALRSLACWPTCEVCIVAIKSSMDAMMGGCGVVVGRRMRNIVMMEVRM